MSDETLELEGGRFIDVAMQHGLLDRQRAEQLLDHSRCRDVLPADAALSLSLLGPHEVDAINLLSHPKDFAPGYRLTGLLGCGAGGLVFRAHQSALGRDVAFKTLMARSPAAPGTGEIRIQREAQAIARLQHPHIVSVYDSGFYQGRFCIAMELVAGETLREFIDRESPVAEEIVWRTIRQVASALAHASDAGIIHRDIKPANLLLAATPVGMDLKSGVPFVKVADFGLALTKDDAASNQVTATGATLERRRMWHLSSYRTPMLMSALTSIHSVPPHSTCSRAKRRTGICHR